MSDPGTGDATAVIGSPHHSELGLIVKMPAPATAEVAGYVGFDMVLLDSEHGASDMSELENHIRAAESAGIRAMVRVSDCASADILRALDAGAKGVVVPHIKSAIELEQAVAAALYPPLGERGLAVTTRAGRHGTRSVSDHIAAAARDTELVAQIEDAEGLDHLDEILEVEGLSGIFIGPMDLSASLGHPGETNHPEVRSSIDAVVDAVLRRRDVRLLTLAQDENEASEWISRGASLVLVSAPALVAKRLAGFASSFGERLGELVAAPKK